MRRPYWCTESKTFFAIVLYTNIAAVTSRENQEYFRTKLRMLNKRLNPLASKELILTRCLGTTA